MKSTTVFATIFVLALTVVVCSNSFASSANGMTEEEEYSVMPYGPPVKHKNGSYSTVCVRDARGKIPVWYIGRFYKSKKTSGKVIGALEFKGKEIDRETFDHYEEQCSATENVGGRMERDSFATNGRWDVFISKNYQLESAVGIITDDEPWVTVK